MNLQVREIVAAMPAPSEPVTGLTARQLTSIAQPIKLRDVLEEMQMIDDAAVPAVPAKTGHGDDESTVVALAVPQARTLRRQLA